MLFHKLLPLIALGLNLLLLGSALAPDRKSHRNLLFAYLATALAVWNLGVFGLRWTTNPDTALGWEQFLHLGVIPIPLLFYHYVLVFLDMPRRRPALIGVITNAVDAMDHGGRLIVQTGIHREADERAMVSVSIADAGRGIPPEHLPRIFEPFYTTKAEAGHRARPVGQPRHRADARRLHRRGEQAGPWYDDARQAARRLTPP